MGDKSSPLGGAGEAGGGLTTRRRMSSRTANNPSAGPPAPPPKPSKRSTIAANHQTHSHVENRQQELQSDDGCGHVTCDHVIECKAVVSRRFSSKRDDATLERFSVSRECLNERKPSSSSSCLPSPNSDHGIRCDGSSDRDPFLESTEPAQRDHVTGVRQISHMFDVGFVSPAFHACSPPPHHQQSLKPKKLPPPVPAKNRSSSSIRESQVPFCTSKLTQVIHNSKQQNQSHAPRQQSNNDNNERDDRCEKISEHADDDSCTTCTDHLQQPNRNSLYSTDSAIFGSTISELVDSSSCTTPSSTDSLPSTEVQKTGSKLEEKQRMIPDAVELEKKLKAAVPAFTTEDFDLFQKPPPSQNQSPQSTQKPEELKRKNKIPDPSVAEHARKNRRSRSVGAPGFQLKDIHLYTQRPPKVPAKPKSRMRQETVVKRLLSNINSREESSETSEATAPDDRTESESVSNSNVSLASYNQTNDDVTSCHENATNHIQDSSESCNEDSPTYEGHGRRMESRVCSDDQQLFLPRNLDLTQKVLHLGSDLTIPFSQTEVSSSSSSLLSIPSSKDNFSGINRYVDAKTDSGGVVEEDYKTEGSFRGSKERRNSNENIDAASSIDLPENQKFCIPAKNQSSSSVPPDAAPRLRSKPEVVETFDSAFSTDPSGLLDSSSLSTEIFTWLNDRTSRNLPSNFSEVISESSEPDRSESNGMKYRAEMLLTAVDNLGKEIEDMRVFTKQDVRTTAAIGVTDRKDSDDARKEEKSRTSILRNASQLPTVRKIESMIRNVSRSQSTKAWKKINRKLSDPRLSRKATSAGFDDLDEEALRVCGDRDDDDAEAESDESDLDYEEEMAALLRLQGAERVKEAKMIKVHHIAAELLATEKSYVRKLHLIDQTFHNEVIVHNREHHMFASEVIPQMFSNIKSIYQFHHDFILPQLEKRMADWNSNPRIGDVMKKFAPFLKLYTEYVKNFDNAINTINYWLEKSAKFQKLIEQLQKLQECGQLSLRHHMLEPVQRVPRYQLILKDYLRHLPQDSCDLDDTRAALELVTKAAWHSNDVMRKIDKFRKLLDISESLGGTVDLTSSSRDLVKEGKITRISARDGDHIERYLFLFNDILLVCQTLPLNTIINTIGQKQQYRVKFRMDMDGVEVLEGHNLETPNTFYVKGKQKSLELHTHSIDEKTEWINAFKQVIRKFEETNAPRRQSVIQTDSDVDVGQRAPTWIKDQETSMCMCCSTSFKTWRRRHHCRACGIVVCGRCSSRRAPLAYLDDREKRVCDLCFQRIVERKPSSASETSVSESPNFGERRHSRKDSVDLPNGLEHGSELNRKGSIESEKSMGEQQPKRHKKAPVILQVKASDPCVTCGYMNMCCNRKRWNKRFFAVHENFVLYSFKAHQDVVAMTSLPLPGYQVSYDEVEGLDNERVFKIFHKSGTKIYYFQTEDKSTRNKWVEILQQATLLQLLPPTSPTCTSPSPFISSPFRSSINRCFDDGY